jgi:hypothetical protein
MLEAIMIKKKDKEVIVDEVWTEQRVRSFLDLTPPAEINPDFNVLYNAYKNMRADNFEQFLGFFSEAGRDFTARNADGKNLLDIMQPHKKAGEYIAAFQQYL